jgi:putative oxidoreductase
MTQEESLKRLLSTTNDPTLTLLRLVLGVVFFAHGAQFVLGWFGGFGYDASMHAFTQQMHIPTALAFGAIMTQFLGGLLLIFGALGRIAALGIAIVMLVAVLMVHIPNGLFMNWYGTQKGEGYEFHILAIAIAIVLMIHGSGAASVDLDISRRLA